MANIYVSTTGNDTTGNGSELNPYLTIQKAVDEYSGSLGDGTGIIIKPGTYTAGAVITDKYCPIYIYDGNVTINGAGGTCFEIVRTVSDTDRAFFLSAYSGFILTVSGFDYALKENRTLSISDYDYTYFAYCNFSNQKIKLSQKSDVFAYCDLSGCDFEYYGNPLLSKVSLMRVVSSNCDNTTGMCLFNNITGSSGFTSYLSGNTFNGAEIIINDIPGSGYTYNYASPSTTSNNAMDGAKVKFSDTDVTLSALALIPFATVYTLVQMQAKADLDMGAGSTMHADSFLFSYTPTPPEDQPNPANRRIPAMGGMCFIETRDKPSRAGIVGGWDSYRLALTDGLISTAYNSVFDENDFAQTTAANRPQYGYDQTAIYDVATLADGSITSFPNTATATARTMPTLTGSAGTEPTKAGGYLNFTSGKKLNIANTSLTLRAFSVEFFGKATGFSASAAVNSNIYFQCRKNPASLNGFYLKLAKTATDAYSFVFLVGNGTNTVSLSTSSYTESQINALLVNDTHIVARFIGGNFSILIDNVVVATTSSTTVTTCVIATVTDIFTSNEMADVTLSMLYNRSYRSHLTDSEIGLLYANKTNPNYQLPKYGIVSEGLSFMTFQWLSNALITDFTAGAWIFLQNVSSYNAAAADQILIASSTFTGTEKGFHLKIQKNNVGQAYFRFVYRDGTTTRSLNSPLLTLAAFRTLYQNKWTMVTCTVKKQGINDLISINVNGVVVSTTSVPSGNFITSNDGVISLLQNNSTNANILAGNKVEDVFLMNRALSQSEQKAQYSYSRSKFRYLNNL